MPLQNKVLDTARKSLKEVASQHSNVDDDILKQIEYAKAYSKEKENYYRRKFIWRIVAPLKATRNPAMRALVKEVKSPRDREWILSDVSRVSKLMQLAQQDEYSRTGFAGRFYKNALKVSGALSDAAMEAIEAGSDLADLVAGKEVSTEDLEYLNYLEAAKEVNNPHIPEERGYPLKMAAWTMKTGAQMAPGVGAAKVAGRTGMWAYWTAMRTPESSKHLQVEGGLDPVSAKYAGALLGGAQGAIETIKIIPGVGRQTGRIVGKSVKETLKNIGREGLETVAATAPEVLEEYLDPVARETATAVASRFTEAPDKPFMDIPRIAAEEMTEAAPVIGLLGAAGGGGKMIAEGKMRKLRAEERVSKTLKAERARKRPIRKRVTDEDIHDEILDHDSSAEIPSRKTWFNRWKMSESGRSRDARLQSTRQLASDVRSYNLVRALIDNRTLSQDEWSKLKLPDAFKAEPDVQQKALGKSLNRGLEVEVPGRVVDVDSGTDVPRIDTQNEVPESLDQAETSINAVLERSDELGKGEGRFLESEAGAIPITGELGQQPRVDVIRQLRETLVHPLPEVERRTQKAHGVTKPGFWKRIGTGIETAWNYATKTRLHLPKDIKFETAREVLRLYDEVPRIAKDEAIRNTRAIIRPVSNSLEEFDLFEQYIIEQNQLHAVELGQPLRRGYENVEQIQARIAQLQQLTNSLPNIQAALANRNVIITSLVKRAVEKGLLSEKALEAPEKYFHQQVLLYQDGKRLGSAGTLRPKKRTFQKRRVTGVDILPERYDYNTSYIESEVEWLTDLGMEVRKQDLLDTLLQEYDRTGTLSALAEEQGITKEEVLREYPNLTLWQPKPGNAFYRAITIPEKVAEALEEHSLNELGLSKEDLGTVLALGGSMKSFIIPIELATQLDSMKAAASPNWLDNLNTSLIKSWKAWVTIISPKRFASYRTRNMLGDYEAMFAGDPYIRNEIDRSFVELLNRRKMRLKLSPDMIEARDHGVVGAGFTAKEVTDIGEIPAFRQVTGKVSMNPLRWYTEKVRAFNEDAEDLLRYAAFKAYKKRIHDGTLTHYGASNPAAIKEIQRTLGDVAAAARLSRDLIGDYGNITLLGDWMRKRLIPFWSFQEINLKRWPRMVMNAVQSRKGRGKLGVAMAGVATMRVASIYAAYWAWNNLIASAFLGDDDIEDQLAPYDRANTKIILGKNPDGSVVIFRNVSTLGEFLEWFGINEIIEMSDKLKSGQKGQWDAMQAVGNGIAQKLLNGIRPDIKAGYEVITGQSLFPDPFHPRKVERGEAVAGVVGLVDEFRWMKGKMLKQGSRPRTHYWQRWGLGVSDPRQNALNETYSLRADFLESKGQTSEGIYPISKYRSARNAAISEDYDAFVEWKKAFIADSESPRKARKGFLKFIDRLDPISARLNRRDEHEFEFEYLTNEQREKLRIARNYAHTLGERLVTWWAAETESTEENSE